MLKPLPIDGGTWSYNCCQWVWIQEGGGWWWETNCGCYNWHGPPGDHPPCPPNPPNCWRWPLPPCGHLLLRAGSVLTEKSCKFPRQRRAPEMWNVIGRKPEEAKRNCGQRDCWYCVDGQVVKLTEAEAEEKGVRCYPSAEEARRHCGEKYCWVCLDGRVVQIPEAEAKAKDIRCYASREEALRSCGGTWWCCVDGRVIQSTGKQKIAKRGWPFARRKKRGGIV